MYDDDYHPFSWLRWMEAALLHPVVLSLEQWRAGMGDGSHLAAVCCTAMVWCTLEHMFNLIIVSLLYILFPSFPTVVQPYDIPGTRRDAVNTLVLSEITGISHLPMLFTPSTNQSTGVLCCRC